MKVLIPLLKKKVCLFPKYCNLELAYRDFYLENIEFYLYICIYIWVVYVANVRRQLFPSTQHPPPPLFSLNQIWALKVLVIFLVA